MLKKHYHNFESFARYWMDELDKYNEQPFKTKPKGSNWSVGQVYDFMANNTINTYLPNVEKCLSKEKEGVTTKGKKTFKGAWMMWTGKYKPAVPLDKIKIKKEPGTPEEEKNKLFSIFKQMSELSRASPDKSRKIKHEKFGYLNAEEWYRLIVMEYGYFIKIKKSIDKKLHYKK